MLDLKKMLMKLSDLVGGDARWTNLNGNVWYKKRCDIVYLRFVSGSSVQLTKTGTTLGTLPTGYRPDYQYDMAGTALGGAEGVFFRVDTSGKITGFASATTSYWSGMVCFPMKVGGGYCLNGLKAVFSMLSAIAERRWRHVRHQENSDQNPCVAQLASCIQTVLYKRLVQFYMVSEPNIRCIAEWIQAHLFGIRHQLGRLLCIQQLLERKHRTSVRSEKRQYRNFEQFKHHLECNLHQRHALQVALSGRGCF